MFSWPSHMNAFTFSVSPHIITFIQSSINNVDSTLDTNCVFSRVDYHDNPLSQKVLSHRGKSDRDTTDDLHPTPTLPELKWKYVRWVNEILVFRTRQGSLQSTSRLQPLTHSFRSLPLTSATQISVHPQISTNSTGT